MMRYSTTIQASRCGLAFLLMGGLTTSVNAGEPPQLKIGTIGGLAPGARGYVAEASLKEFISKETGLSADFVRIKNWEELADKLEDKSIQVGIFQGHEFSWAKQRRPSIKPMVLAVNSSRYPVAYVMISKTSSATALKDLQGKAVGIQSDRSHLPLFIEEQTSAAGNPAAQFFSKISVITSSEDALDQVVDGKLSAAIVDRGALEMFQRRKPGRHALLKELINSQPMLPPIIAISGEGGDEVMRQQFEKALTTANKQSRGQTLLNTFNLKAFEAPQPDFHKVRQDMLRTFPAPKR